MVGFQIPLKIAQHVTWLPAYGVESHVTTAKAANFTLHLYERTNVAYTVNYCTLRSQHVNGEAKCLQSVIT